MGDHSAIIAEIEALSKVEHPHQIAGNTVCLVISGVLGTALAYRAYTTRQIHKWAFILPVGYIHFMIGFIFRLLARRWPHSSFVNAAGFILIYVSPYCIMAANVLQFSRICSLAETGSILPRMKFMAHSRHSLVPPRLSVWIICILLNIILLFYTTASGLQSIPNYAPFSYLIVLFSASIGAGIYGLYLLHLAYCQFSITRSHKKEYEGATLFNTPLNQVFALIWLTSLLFYFRLALQIRSGMEGGLSHLWTDERYLFCFDALPTFLAGIAFIVFWPPSLLDKATQHGSTSITSSSELVQGTA